MKDILNFIKEFLVSLGILISMIVMPFASTEYEAKDNNANLVFSAVSDVHIETNNSTTYSTFQKILKDIKGNKSSDATVFLGDNTMNGQIPENSFFFGGVKAVLGKEKNTVVMLGNHDIGNGEGEYETLLKRFISYNNTHLKNKIEKPYFYKIIDGSYMIFLATEKHSVNNMYISDEQFSWLKGLLDEADKEGNPAFVFAHHPAFYLDSDNSYKLLDLFENYKNIYFLHGHTHTKFNIYNMGNTVCINLPRVTETVDYNPGIGIVVEVYDDSVILRERNFYDGEWLSEAVYENK